MFDVWDVVSVNMYDLDLPISLFNECFGRSEFVLASTFDFIGALGFRYQIHFIDSGKRKVSLSGLFELVEEYHYFTYEGLHSISAYRFKMV